jgi:hypothetical protein
LEMRPLVILSGELALDRQRWPAREQNTKRRGAKRRVMEIRVADREESGTANLAVAGPHVECGGRTERDTVRDGRRVRRRIGGQ